MKPLPKQTLSLTRHISAHRQSSGNVDSDYDDHLVAAPAAQPHAEILCNWT